MESIEELKGEIVKVFAIKGGWSSFKLVTPNGETINCAGSMSDPYEGASVELKGETSIHPTYGLQFKVSEGKVRPEMSERAIKGFMRQFLCGIGDTIADAIYEKFGKGSIDVIENHPDDLLSIKGISKKKLDKIIYSYKESKAYREIINFFDGSITENQAMKIFAKYGSEAIEVLEKNPYQLIYDIDGFGFKKVDALALKIEGIEPDSSVRVGAAIVYTLKQLSTTGDCFVEAETLQAKLVDCLNREKVDVPVATNKLADEIINQVAEGKLVVEADENDPEVTRVYLKYLHSAEVKASECIKKLLKQKIKQKDYTQDISKYESDYNLVFDDIQKQAVQMGLNNSLSVITGGPGMGKTTIIQVIIDLTKKDVVCLAPTGRAAKRMSEATGRVAKTISKFEMENGLSPIYKPREYVDNTLFIVDESSMVDITMGARLLSYISEGENNAVVFVGDINQLPSIGAGNFLRDMIISNRIPVTTLQFSYRFGGTIAKDAKLINEGYKYSDLEFDEFVEIVKTPKETIVESLEKKYKELMQKFSVDEILVLSPMRVKSQSGVDTLNKRLREIYNPQKGKVAQSNPFTDFRVGDRVMNTANDYKIEGVDIKTGAPEVGVFNGDLGFISDINYYSKCVTVDFDDGRRFIFNAGHLPNLVLGNAMTYHKSQGSEAKAVICILSNEHTYMANRNLLYTGATRAKEKLVFMGDVYAINTAIQNVQPLTRNTMLAERIRG